MPTHLSYREDTVRVPERGRKLSKITQLSYAKAVSPTGCDCGLGENPALGSRNQVWTLLHLRSHVGGSQVPCELVRLPQVQTRGDSAI